MALGTNHQTVTTHANFIPEVWSKEVQVATEANLVMAKLVKRFDRDVLRKGDTIHIPKIAELSATSKSANTEITPAVNTEGVVDLSIDKHYYIAFLLEDILDSQSAYEHQEAYKKKVAYGLAKQVDTDLAGLYTGLSQSVGTAGMAPTDANINRAIQYLDDADAPMTDRCFVMKPACASSLLQIDRYVSTDFVRDQPVMNGLFGERYGVMYYKSTNIQTSSDNPQNLLFQKEAFALAMQKDIKVETQRKAEFLGDLTVGQVLYGVVEYRDDHAVIVNSNA